jgi:hypothetical protein
MRPIRARYAPGGRPGCAKGAKTAAKQRCTRTCISATGAMGDGQSASHRGILLAFIAATLRRVHSMISPQPQIVVGSDHRQSAGSNQEEAGWGEERAQPAGSHGKGGCRRRTQPDASDGGWALAGELEQGDPVRSSSDSSGPSLLSMAHDQLGDRARRRARMCFFCRKRACGITPRERRVIRVSAAGARLASPMPLLPPVPFCFCAGFVIFPVWFP